MFTSSEMIAYREKVLFRTEVNALGGTLASLADDLVREHRGATTDRRIAIEDVLSELTIDLGSYLPRWKLLPPGHDESDATRVTAAIERNLQLLRSLDRGDLAERARNEITEISAGNLRRLSELTDRGVLNSRWGNDSAVGLIRAARRGAVLITTNPVMINNVRKENPDYWAREKAALRHNHPHFTPEKLASYMTLEVVRKNCREFRPIFEAGEGRYGYVCLQVNPRNAKDPESMAAEALELYDQLGSDYDGKPNAAFKIPGTRAGLRAAEILAAAGVPVTMTASASLSQMIAMASILDQGTAPVSFLTVMNGRLDDPVGEELEAKGVADGREVARWCSTLLIRKAYRLLYIEMGIKIPTILAASMRGPWNIEGSITAGEKETIITAFPDKAAEFDAAPRTLRSTIDQEPPRRIIETLEKSAIFRQAYYPEELAIDGFDDFYPVRVTLAQFEKNYDEFLGWVAGPT